MAKQILLKYTGRTTRTIGIESAAIGSVNPGDEIMVPERVAGELLAMNGTLTRKGENEIMWQDLTTKPKPKTPKRRTSKKAVTEVPEVPEEEST